MTSDSDKKERRRRFIEIQENLGMTGVEFANLLGVNQAYVSMIRNGKKSPGARLLADAERAVGGDGAAETVGEGGGEGYGLDYLRVRLTGQARAKAERAARVSGVPVAVWAEAVLSAEAERGTTVKIEVIRGQ